MLFSDCGADINHRDGTGQTPLHFAALAGQSNEKISMLLRFGADAQAVDDAGNDAIMLAIIHDQPNALRAMLHALRASAPQEVRHSSTAACAVRGFSMALHSGSEHR